MLINNTDSDSGKFINIKKSCTTKTDAYLATYPKTVQQGKKIKQNTGRYNFHYISVTPLQINFTVRDHFPPSVKHKQATCCSIC